MDRVLKPLIAICSHRTHHVGRRTRGWTIRTRCRSHRTERTARRPDRGATAGAAYGNSEVRSIMLGGEEVMGAIGPEPLAGMGWLKTEASNTAEDFEGRERRVSIVTPISRTAPIAPSRPSTPDSMPRTSDERSSSMLAPCSGSGRGTRDAGHPSQSGSGDPPNSSGQTSPSNPPSSSP